MKYATAYYLFLLYCTVLLRCAIPVACDALHHIFNEEEHLATIHAVYGNNHLQKEIAATENGCNKNTASIKYEEPVQFHLKACFLTLIDFIDKKTQIPFGFTASHCLPVYLQQTVPPPKFFS